MASRTIKDVLATSVFLRIAQIHQKLCNEEKMTAETLAADLEVSVRTIMRDIDAMATVIHVPVEWSPAQHSYILTRPCPTLPLLRMTAREALVLALAGRFSARLAGSAFGHVLSSLLEKVAPVYGHAVAVRVDAAASVLAAPRTVNDDALEHFFELLEATLDRRVLRFDYHNPKTDQLEPRTVHPLLLADDDEGALLVTYDTERKDIRNFDLVRIRNLRTLNETFQPPADFDAKRHVEEGCGRFSGRETHEVRIALDKTAAFYALEKPWHRSQELVETTDGGAEITLRVNHLAGVRRLVLAWAEHVEVLSPPALRDEVRKSLAAALARYGGKG